MILKNKHIQYKSLIGLFVCFNVIFLIFNFIPTANATDPSEIAIGYTEEANSVWVDIYHQTENPDEHYVNYIQVILNGETIFSETYINQPTNNFYGILVEDIIAVDDDVLEARVTCNQGGETYTSITLGEVDFSLDATSIGITIAALTFTVLIFTLIKRKRT